MIDKAVGSVVLAITMLIPLATAQPSTIGRLSGRVLEDGRPIRRIVEVRLESGTSGLVDTAYTMGSDEFEFRAVPIDLSDRYFLVIEEDGYRDVREEIQIGRDPFGVGVIADFGLVLLRLETIPEEGRDGARDTVDLRELMADIPDRAHDAYSEALDLLDRGEIEAALERLERAIEFAPDYYDALNTLGVEYLHRQRYGRAKEVLNRAYALNPEDPILLTNLGSLHFQEGQVLEQSALNPSEVEIAVASYANAAEYLREALRRDPGSGRIAYYLGSALYKTGRYEAAEEALFLSMDSDPSMDDARLTLINVYVRQQRHDEALEQIALYLDANPDTPERASMEQARAAIEAVMESSER